MNFKVGDKVKIRQWDDMAREFGVDRDGDIRVPATFVKSMRKYCGKIFEIAEKTDGDRYTLKGADFSYSSGMFEKSLDNFEQEE